MPISHTWYRFFPWVHQTPPRYHLGLYWCFHCLHRGLHQRVNGLYQTVQMILDSSTRGAGKSKTVYADHMHLFLKSYEKGNGLKSMINTEKLHQLNYATLRLLVTHLKGLWEIFDENGIQNKNTPHKPNQVNKQTKRKTNKPNKKRPNK